MNKKKKKQQRQVLAKNCSFSEQFFWWAQTQNNKNHYYIIIRKFYQFLYFFYWKQNKAFRFVLKLVYFKGLDGSKQYAHTVCVIKGTNSPPLGKIKSTTNPILSAEIVQTCCHWFESVKKSEPESAFHRHGTNLHVEVGSKICILLSNHITLLPGSTNRKPESKK